jgi:hypothetical protein
MNYIVEEMNELSLRLNHIHLKAHIEALEAKVAKAVDALEKLARLGNGDRYGNSDGNMIARAALAELRGRKK